MNMVYEDYVAIFVLCCFPSFTGSLLCRIPVLEHNHTCNLFKNESHSLDKLIDVMKFVYINI